MPQSLFLDADSNIWALPACLLISSSTSSSMPRGTAYAFSQIRIKISGFNSIFQFEISTPANIRFTNSIVALADIHGSDSQPCQIDKVYTTLCKFLRPVLRRMVNNVNPESIISSSHTHTLSFSFHFSFPFCPPISQIICVSNYRWSFDIP